MVRYSQWRGMGDNNMVARDCAIFFCGEGLSWGIGLNGL